MEETLEKFPLLEYGDKYKVSSDGKILSKRTKRYLKTQIYKGYNVVTLNESRGATNLTKNVRVCTLVALAFLEKKDEDTVWHKNGNKLDDRLENLEWVSWPEYLSRLYPNEIWKKIRRFPKYFISDKGNVWSISWELLIKQGIKCGYKSVMIGYPNRTFIYVHRLVAEEFIPKDQNRDVVNHKNGERSDNSVENLEWVTHLENCQHARSTGLTHNNRTFELKSEEPEDGKELEILPGYLITGDGKVYGKYRGRFLKGTIKKDGYCRVVIRRKNHYVHRLVAMAFLGEPEKGKNQVNHKDLNKKNNNIENLEWVSPSENMQHSVAKNPNKFRHLQKKVAKLDRTTGETLEVYAGLKEAGRKTGTNVGSISKVCRGMKPSAGGYRWIYATS